MAATGADRPAAAVRRLGISGWEALSGLGFVAFFIAGVAASSPPANNAPDSRWIADYTGHDKQAGHLATGLLLVLAGLSLLTFLTGLWRGINRAPAGPAPQARCQPSWPP